MTKRRKLGVGIAFLAAVILVAAAFLIGEFVSAEDPPPTLGDSVFDPSSMLLTHNRDKLSICVDGDGSGEASHDAVNIVELALKEALADAPDLPSEYSRTAVSAGCPLPGALASPDVGTKRKLGAEDWTVGDEVIGQPGAPSEPSPHRAFVYFLTPEAYSRSFSAEPYFSATAETIRVADVNTGVTTALYVRTTADSRTLRDALSDILNLYPPSENEDVDDQFRQNCELGTPDIWCAGLLDEETPEG